MKLFLMISIIVLVLLLVVILESRREISRIKITEYEIRSPKLPPALNGKSLVFFSDFHNAGGGKYNQKIIQMIKNIDPVCVLIGGDMIVGREGVSTEASSSLLNGIAHDYPVYYGIGNHERRVSNHTEIFGTLWEDYRKNLDPAICILEDTNILLQYSDAALRIYGLDLDRFYYKRFFVQDMDTDYLNKKMGAIDKEHFTILLAHNPDYFPVYEAWGADLTLSGHVHGGIIRLPILGGVVSPRLTLFPRYDKGLYERNGRKMILSGGLGQHSIPVRIGNLPEIVWIHLKNDK